MILHIKKKPHPLNHWGEEETPFQTTVPGPSCTRLRRHALCGFVGIATVQYVEPTRLSVATDGNSADMRTSVMLLKPMKMPYLF